MDKRDLHDTIASNDDCYSLLEKAWRPMHDEGVHVHMRAWKYEPAGATVGLVVVARGTAAQMIEAFVREHVPPYDGYYERDGSGS